MLMGIDICTNVVKIDDMNYDFTNSKLFDIFAPRDPFVFAKYLDDNHILKTINRHDYGEIGEDDIIDVAKLRSFAISASDNKDIINFINTIRSDAVYVLNV